MKVGILYICTGKYSIFWNTFYDSAEKFFLNNKNVDKHYFVFSDDTSIKKKENIHLIYKVSEGFPLDTLMRFDMFLTIEEELKEMDYVFFFNSNMLFIKEVGTEIIPAEKKTKLLGVLHPGYYNKNKYKLPYERNKKSTAYIPYRKNDDYKYFMGGFNGGSVEAFLKLCKVCSENIKMDMKNKIIAKYHDESYINTYFHNKDILVLDPSYGYPEGANLPFDPKIIIGNKIKRGGKYFDKLPKKSYIQRAKLKIKNIYYSLIWKFQ